MGKAMVKATYSLDEETIRSLELLAQRLGTSKSEVLRRAIDHLTRLQPEPGDDALAALDDLQGTLALAPADVEAWEAEVRAERLATGDG